MHILPLAKFMVEKTQKTKVLVVDDSVIYRKVLTDAMGQIEGIEVIGTAPHGALALKKLALQPADLVLLDVFMPEMDGVETLKHIKKDFPKTSVIMISGATTKDAGITLQALAMGALDFIPKPQTESAEKSMEFLKSELKRVVQLFYLKNPKSSYGVISTGTQRIPIQKPPKPIVIKPIPAGKFNLVVIGVSTGGPNALGVLIPHLPADLGCPVLVVQHMPPMFTASLADHLNKKSPLEVREAKEGDLLQANTVLIAPGGYHMTIKKNGVQNLEYKIVLNQDPPVHSCRPAVDVLFKSVSENMNGNILSVVLTGMGEDGANGVEILKSKKAYCLAQDEKTSVVYGMPRAVAQRGLADEILPLEMIASRITALVKERAK
jgi:two-component system chemotaxis response regulator CheB